VAKRANAAEKPLTAVCPAWLRLDCDRFVVIEDRAEVVRRVFTEAAAGKGQHAIAEGLNRDGVPTFGHRGRQGKHWHRSYVVKLLQSLAAIGTCVPHRMDYSKGKPRRIAQDAVPGYYPAVVDPALWEQVQAIRTSQQPLRGRHAHTGVVRNVLAGLARCAHCGSTMTRMTKGGRWVYLVCTKAKAGAGCSYRLVPYQPVEYAILNGADRIAYECPTGNPEADLAARKVDALDDQISLLQDDIARLIGYAGRTRSPAIAQQVVDLEAAIEDARKRQSELGRVAALAMPERITARLGAFTAACGQLEGHRSDTEVATEESRGAVNAALRALCRTVEVDREDGVVVLNFLHGGEVVLRWNHHWSEP
jgi:hypothetical protein